MLFLPRTHHPLLIQRAGGVVSGGHRYAVGPSKLHFHIYHQQEQVWAVRWATDIVSSQVLNFWMTIKYDLYMYVCAFYSFCIVRQTLSSGIPLWEVFLSPTLSQTARVIQSWRAEKREKGLLMVELKQSESKEEKTLNMEISALIGIGLYQLQFANNDELDITRRKMVTWVAKIIV